MKLGLRCLYNNYLITSELMWKVKDSRWILIFSINKFMRTSWAWFLRKAHETWNMDLVVRNITWQFNKNLYITRLKASVSLVFSCWVLVICHFPTKPYKRRILCCLSWTISDFHSSFFSFLFPLGWFGTLPSRSLWLRWLSALLWISTVFSFCCLFALLFSFLCWFSLFACFPFCWLFTSPTVFFWALRHCQEREKQNQSYLISGKT